MKALALVLLAGIFRRRLTPKSKRPQPTEPVKTIAAI